MGTLIKNFIKFEKEFDFNSISNLLDRNNLESKISSNWLQNYIFESTFVINKLSEDILFNDIYLKLNTLYNKNNYRSDLDIYFSLVSGNKSITHRENYNVYIVGLLGKTIYKVENEEFMVEKNDILFIPKNALHKAIGITPRIILSYGIYND
jgi:mannose-6-phosphate isomerase-like protein (cupin superfamily)